MSTIDHSTANILNASTATNFSLHLPTEKPEYAITVDLKKVEAIVHEIFGPVLRFEFEHDPEIENYDYVNVWVKAPGDSKEILRRHGEWALRVADEFGLDARQVCLAFEFPE